MPAARLSPTDLVIVAVYIAGMTVMGAWFTRKQKDLKAYFVGGLPSDYATQRRMEGFADAIVPGQGTPPRGC